MSLHEHDPILEPLFGLPRPAEDPDRSARVRQRCHALMASRVASQAPHSRPAPRRGRLDNALVLALGLYLVVALVEVVRVVGSF